MNATAMSQPRREIWKRSTETGGNRTTRTDLKTRDWVALSTHRAKRQQQDALPKQEMRRDGQDGDEEDAMGEWEPAPSFLQHPPVTLVLSLLEVQNAAGHPVGEVVAGFGKAGGVEEWTPELEDTQPLRAQPSRPVCVVAAPGVQER